MAIATLPLALINCALFELIWLEIHSTFSVDILQLLIIKGAKLLEALHRIRVRERWHFTYRFAIFWNGRVGGLLL